MTRSVWQILAQKYDTRPHYTSQAVLLDDDGQQLRLASEAREGPFGILAHQSTT
jgi:hypothetical protein